MTFYDRTEVCIAFQKDRRAWVTPALKRFVVRLPKLIIALVGADTPRSDHVSTSSFRITTGEAGLHAALADADEKAEKTGVFSASGYSIPTIGPDSDTASTYTLETSTAVFAVQRNSPVTHHSVKIWAEPSVVAWINSLRQRCFEMVGWNSPISTLTLTISDAAVFSPYAKQCQRDAEVQLGQIAYHRAVHFSCKG